MVLLFVLVFLLCGLCRCWDNDACYIHGGTSLAVGIIIGTDAFDLATLALITALIS